MQVVRFLRDRRGGVAPLLALSMIPIVGAVGSAVDYSRAAAIRSELQNAMDSALLAAATGDPSVRMQELSSSPPGLMVEVTFTAIDECPRSPMNLVGTLAVAVPT